jgi:hypothetical protein
MPAAISTPLLSGLYAPGKNPGDLGFGPFTSKVMSVKVKKIRRWN